MGRPKLAKKDRKDKTVWARVTSEEYSILLDEAGDAKKIPSILRDKIRKTK